MTRELYPLFRRATPLLPRLLLGSASCLALIACQKNGAEAPDYAKSAAQKDERRTAATSANPASAEVFRVEKFTKLADVAQGSFGPRLHPAGTGWVAVWATPQGEKPGWYSSHVTRRGEVSEPLWLAEITPGLRQFTLGTVNQGEVAVLAIRRGGKKEVLEVLRLGPQGALLGGPRLVADSPAAILWADVAQTAKGGLVAWAERDASSADIYSAVWTNTGIEKPQRIVRDAFSWQLATRAGSVALASFEDARGRRVVVRQLGAQGQTIGAPVTLASHVDGALDLDMAMTEQNLVVAWSQHDRFERRIYRAVLDSSGNVTQSAGLLSAPRGDQALVHLETSPALAGAAEEDEIVAVWEEPLVSREQGRTLLVSSFLASDKNIQPQARLLSRGTDALLPMISPASSGKLAVLSESSHQDYLGFLTDFVQSAGPAVALKDGVEVSGLSMAWDLSCVEGECFALVADGASPAQVFLAPIQSGGSEPSPWTALGQLGGPQMRTREALSEVPELVAMSGRLSGDGSSALLSWLSYFDPNQPYTTPSAPAPDGRRAPVRARLENQVIACDASSVASNQVISYRARSLGGVELSFRNENQGLMVWAALDGAAPQMFATLLDAQGRKVQQKMVTKSTGEITDVNVIAVESGYIVAWVESTGNRAEVWAMPLSEQLVSGTPQQLSTGASTPIGLSLTRLGKQVSLVWADSRGTSKGHADLFSVFLDETSAAPLDREMQLIDSDLHSHSPQLIPFTQADRSAVSGSEASGAEAGRATLVWIESDLTPDPSGRASGTLYYADYLPSRGLGEAIAVTQLPSALSFSAECSKMNCRALVATQDRHAELWALTWPRPASLSSNGAGAKGAPEAAQNDSQLRVNQLLSLRSASASATTPLLLGDVGFYADKDESGEKWLLNRVEVDWGLSE